MMKNRNNKKNSTKCSEGINNKEKAIAPIKSVISFIWKKFNESLVFAVIKACLLIFALIYLIFTIKPSQAHVSVSISEIDDRTMQIYAESMSYKSKNESELKIYSYGALNISLRKYEVEGYSIPDQGNYWIIIYPDENEFIPECCFIMTGQMDEVILNDIHAPNLHYCQADSANFYLSGPQHFQITNGSAVIVTPKQGKLEKIAEIEGDAFNLIERTTEPSASTYGPHLEEYVISYDLSVFAVSSMYSDEDLQNSEFNKVGIDARIHYDVGSISFERISSFLSIVTGKLALSLTPTPLEYSLNKQELRLDSATTYNDGLALECNVNYKVDDDTYESEGILYGYVVDGEISKTSLFPSFKTWFYSNAYLTPTAIIAIILTAIALFNKKNSDVKNPDKEE